MLMNKESLETGLGAIDNKKKDLSKKDLSKKDLSKDFSVLLSDKGKFSTCCNCSIDCDPRTCDMLTEWIG